MFAEVSVSIARPPAEVFEFVSDVRNEPQWHTDILDAWLTSDGTVGAGSTFGIRIKPFMGQSDGAMTIMEYEPPRRVVFQGRMGKMEPTVIHTVEPEEQGTRFTRRIVMQPPGLMRLMTPFMRRMVRNSNTGFLTNLKRTLEVR